MKDQYAMTVAAKMRNRGEVFVALLCCSSYIHISVSWLWLVYVLKALTEMPPVEGSASGNRWSDRGADAQSVGPASQTASQPAG